MLVSFLEDMWKEMETEWIFDTFSLTYAKCFEYRTTCLHGGLKPPATPFPYNAYVSSLRVTSVNSIIFSIQFQSQPQLLDGSRVAVERDRKSVV